MNMTESELKALAQTLGLQLKTQKSASSRVKTITTTEEERLALIYAQDARMRLQAQRNVARQQYLTAHTWNQLTEDKSL